MKRLVLESCDYSSLNVFTSLILSLPHLKELQLTGWKLSSKTDDCFETLQVTENTEIHFM